MARRRSTDQSPSHDCNVIKVRHSNEKSSLTQNRLRANFHHRSWHSKLRAANGSPGGIRFFNQFVFDGNKVSQMLSHTDVVAGQFNNARQITAGLEQNRFDILKGEPKLFD